jgi:hypothetical protein
MVIAATLIGVNMPEKSEMSISQGHSMPQGLEMPALNMTQ